MREQLQKLVVTVFGLKLGDLSVDLDHVQALHSVHDLLKSVTGNAPA